MISDLGDLHLGRKKVQPSSREIQEFYKEAKGVLRYELRTFVESEIEVVACSSRETLKRRRYTCYACALMPDHVHMVIRRHRDHAEDMIEHLQNDSRLALLDAKYRESNHPVWGGPGWKVFLDTPDDIRRTIRYVEENPIKIRWPVQQWDFVTPYDGWLPTPPPRRLR